MKFTPAFLFIFVLSVHSIYPQTRFSAGSPYLIDTTGPTLSTYIYAGAGVGSPFIALSLGAMAEVEEHYSVSLGTDALQELDIGGGGEEYHTLNFIAGYAATHKSLHGVFGGGIIVVFEEGVSPVFSLKADFIFAKHFGIGGEFRIVIPNGVAHGGSGMYFALLNLIAKF